MSRNFNAEKGTSGEFSGELRTSVSGRFKRYIHCGVDIDESGSLKKFSKAVLRSLPLKKMDGIKRKIFVSHGPWDDWIRITLFMIALSVDPLFFYVPVINDDKKCLHMDWNLLIKACCLRVLCDAVHMIYIAKRSDTGCSMHEGKKSHKSPLTDFLLTFPLPQMMLLNLMTNMRPMESLHPVKLVQLLIFIQYVPRVIRICSLFTQATRTPGKDSEITWGRVAFGLLLYLQAAHVCGALWYVMAIERETECWEKASINHRGHSYCSFNCGPNLGDYTFLNELCPTKTRNAAIHDFGIFHDALESGIVEVTDFQQKFLHCFRWGLRSLSTLGQNQQTSGDLQENFFMISIIGFGLLLFSLLIGNMQTYLNSRTVRLREMTLKAREIEEWAPFRKLSWNLQREVMKYQRFIWRKTNDIDVENLLNNLPKELRRKIKREFCLQLLKKVEEFKKLRDEILVALCDYVKPAFFIQQTHVIREGDPIDEMIFVVQGKLSTYSFRDTTSIGCMTSNHFSDNCNNVSKIYLVDGDFCGEELVDWALKNRSSSDIPKSTRTVQAVTNVEAFTLMADDLKYVLIEQPLYELMNQAARIIQLAWRRHHSRSPYLGELAKIHPRRWSLQAWKLPMIHKRRSPYLSQQ